MCIVVIAGGPNKNLLPLLPTLRGAEEIICADSGADSLMPYDIVPETVWGDMDSISEKTVSWLKEKNVSHKLFPVEKDMTDSELCLTSVPKEKELLFVTSLMGRPDHVMSNLLLTMRLKEEGYNITTTDGDTWIFPINGAFRFAIPDELVKENITCSLIPLGKGSKGVSTFGMKYKLSDRDIIPGSSLTVSNEFDMTEKEHGFEQKSGTMLVIVTPKV